MFGVLSVVVYLLFLCVWAGGVYMEGGESFKSGVLLLQLKIISE
jgi:hypothetical protein